MPASDHDRAEDKFAENVPPTAKGIRNIGQSDADAYAAVCGNDFEDDVEDGVGDGVTLKVGSFCDGDEQYREDDPP